MSFYNTMSEIRKIIQALEVVHLEIMMYSEEK